MNKIAGVFEAFKIAAYLAGIIISAICINIFNPEVVPADEITPVITSSTGRNLSSMNKRDYATGETFKAGEMITICAQDGRSIREIYIVWDSPVTPYTVMTDNGSIACGSDGFLHDRVDLKQDTLKVTINIPQDGMRIAYIRIFDAEGELPRDIQIWRAPKEGAADIMIVAAHADDDILFFGGIIPTYAITRDADVQVVFMSEFWSTKKIREHEKLDGLWAAGLDIYPVSGNFKDLYSNNLERAMKQYKIEDMTAYLTGVIRRFKPQVVVTHDENGEYGHGFHRLTSKAVIMAADEAADESADIPSLEKYGIWNIPKTYVHLYQENKIRLNLRMPIEGMDGRNALEIAADAYKMHVSQQWCWFYVSDEYQYSCADFGLYRTMVGIDTEDDLLCNLKTYKQQKLEAESISIAESIEQASREEESRRESIEQASREAESISILEEKEREEKEEKAERKARNTGILILSAALTAIISGGLLFKPILKIKK